MILFYAYFVWQVWGMVAIEGANGDSRDRRGESCRKRAFRMASVRNRATWYVAVHRSIWQAYRIVRGS